MSKFSVKEPKNSIGLQFWKLHNKWQRRITEALLPFEITHTQFVILATVQWYDEQSMTPSQADISKVSGIDKMTLSKAIAGLGKSGLIKKVKSRADSRSMNILLTKKSIRYLPEIISTVESIDKEIFAIKCNKTKMLFIDNLVELNSLIDTI